jgi:hypothetical protein
VKRFSAMLAVACFVTAFFAPNPHRLPMRAFFEVSTNLVTWRRFEQTYPTRGGWLVLTNPYPQAPKVYFRAGYVFE